MSRRSAHPGRSILFAYAGIAVPAAVAVVLVPLLLRNLGATRFGLLSLLLSVATFFTNFDFGTGPALARYTSRLRARPGSEGRIARLAIAGMAVQAVVGLGTATIIFAALRIAGLVSAEKAGVPAGEFTRAVALVAIATPFALQGGGARSVLEGMGRFGLANAIRAPASASNFAVPIAVSFLSPRLDVMMAGLLAARIGTSGAFAWALGRAFPRERPPLRAAYVTRVGKRLLSYGGWVMLGVAAGGLMTLGVLDRLVIDKLLGPVAIVSYAIPSDVIVRSLLAPGAIASVLIPLLSGAIVQGRPFGAALERATGILSAQVGPLALVLVLGADLILQLLTKGVAGPSSRDILQAMAVGFFVHSVAHAPYAGLQALGSPNRAALRHVVELPFYAVASVLLVRAGRLDLLGLLWAVWTVADLALVGWLVRSLRPELRSAECGLGARTWLWMAGLCAAVAATRLGLPGPAAIAIAAGALVYWAVGTYRLATLRHE